jgi:uncharacterized protein
MGVLFFLFRRSKKILIDLMDSIANQGHSSRQKQIVLAQKMFTVLDNFDQGFVEVSQLRRAFHVLGLDEENVEEMLYAFNPNWAARVVLADFISVVVQGIAGVSLVATQADKAAAAAAAKKAKEDADKAAAAKKAQEDEQAQVAASAAAAAAQAQLAQLLASAGVKHLEQVDQDGFTALTRAARSGDEAKVKQLLAAKANINAKDNDNNTALIWAASEGHTPIAQALIEAKADLNANAKYGGFTALIQAAARGRTPIAQALIEAKADLNAKNNWGYTALYCAKDYKHQAIVAMLEQAGAKQ